MGYKEYRPVLYSALGHRVARFIPGALRKVNDSESECVRAESRRDSANPPADRSFRTGLGVTPASGDERSPPSSSSSPNVDITGPHPGMDPERETPVMARCRCINRLVQKLLEVIVRGHFL